MLGRTGSEWEACNLRDVPAVLLSSQQWGAVKGALTGRGWTGSWAR